MTTKLTEVTLSQLSPNPFRDIDTYPFDEEKITRLQESISSTGFWPTVIARAAGSGYEIAFGHHRIEAAKREGIKKATILVDSLSDEEMLKMMVDENAIEYGHDFLSTLNSVGSVVNAFGRGAIELDPVSDEARGRSSFINDKPFSALTVARFLGWVANDKPVDRVNIAIQALSLLEKKLCRVEQFRGLNQRSAMALVRDATIQLKIEEKRQKTIEDERERHAASKKAHQDIRARMQKRSEDLKKGRVSTKEVLADAKEARESFTPTAPKKVGKQLDKAALRVATFFERRSEELTERYPTFLVLVKAIGEKENQIDTTTLSRLTRAISALSKKEAKYITALAGAVEKRRS
jgi:ParB-like chromosome segregation protein Spo0J